MTKDEELQPAYDNLAAVQRRCGDLLRENRALRGIVSLRVRLLSPLARLPRYAHEGDSGLDLCAALEKPMAIHAGHRASIPTGIALELPRGLEGQVRPRSGLARDHGVATFFGTIDSNYRGEIGVTLQNHGDTWFTVHPGDRVAQLVIVPVLTAELEVADELTETVRGAAGFGSTGVR